MSHNQVIRELGLIRGVRLKEKLKKAIHSLETNENIKRIFELDPKKKNPAINKYRHLIKAYKDLSREIL